MDSYEEGPGGYWDGSEWIESATIPEGMPRTREPGPHTMLQGEFPIDRGALALGALILGIVGLVIGAAVAWLVGS